MPFHFTSLQSTAVLRDWIGMASLVLNIDDTCRDFLSLRNELRENNSLRTPCVLLVVFLAVPKEVVVLVATEIAEVYVVKFSYLSRLISYNLKTAPTVKKVVSCQE